MHPYVSLCVSDVACLIYTIHYILSNVIAPRAKHCSLSLSLAWSLSPHHGRAHTPDLRLGAKERTAVRTSRDIGQNGAPLAQIASKIL